MVLSEIKTNQFKIDIQTKEGISKNGPLDLLWMLIESYEVDIFNVSLTRITNDFCLYIEKNDITIDEKADFIVMGTRLIYYKSKLLTPSSNIDDDYESDSLPLELVEQLLQYKKFQGAAKNLREIEEMANMNMVRGAIWHNYEKGQDYLDVDLVALLKAFQQFLLSVEKSELMSIEEEEINTELIINELRKILLLESEVSFFLFIKKFTLLKIIGTFLALLEMAKMREIMIVQDSQNDDIKIKKNYINNN
ncbi:MAG: segregation/condensation protein A [Spirochaetia bacterium]|nr:segregation/condensation protein A [Spirochaetia bacterium]